MSSVTTHGTPDVVDKVVELIIFTFNTDKHFIIALRYGVHRVRSSSPQPCMPHLCACSDVACIVLME